MLDPSHPDGSFCFQDAVRVARCGRMEQAKIGPNSIIQTVQALKETYGIPQTNEILQRGGHSQLIERLPSEMVQEQEFLRLIQALIGQLGAEPTMTILRRSGQLTAFYLLKHRIPHPFQKLLNVLPLAPGFTLLLFAIKKSAWTFVGSGLFSFVGGREPKIIIANRHAEQHIPAEICSFYAGTFEQIFQSLLDEHTQVQAIAGQPGSDVRCAYAVHFGTNKK